MANLYIIATPIGNLGDISLRALDALRGVSLILAEDTRVTAKLLAAYDIAVPLVAYHQHSGPQAARKAIQTLQDGSDIALVSDAGTPGINDPGGKMVHEVMQALPEVAIVPIPGANAAIAALSVCGFPTDRFHYLGFAPHKKGRQTFFQEVADCEDTVVFYESKHRIEKALATMGERMPERHMMLARELTKQHETLYRGTPAQVHEALLADKVLGEFVVVVEPWKVR